MPKFNYRKMEIVTLLKSEYEFQLARVIDGDTLEGDIVLGFGIALNNWQVRLYGVDAPEMYGMAKGAGQIVKQALETYITGSQLRIVTRIPQYEKYGRILADVLIFANDGKWYNVGDWLLKCNYAKPITYGRGKMTSGQSH